ncbi:MAG: hypothetical protein ACTSXJ_01215 [Candidatus Baldrarchaeia archaeon]
MEEDRIPVYVEGLTEIPDDEKSALDKVVQKYITRFQRVLTGVNFLKIRIRPPKEDQPGRYHFEVNVQLAMPGRSFETNALGWRLLDVVEEALSKLSEQIKRFKSRRKEILRREK